MSRFIPRAKVQQEAYRQRQSKTAFVNRGLKDGSLVKWPDAVKGPYIMAKEKAEELTRLAAAKKVEGL